MIIQDAHSHGSQLSISRSCQAFEVSRSGYCEWIKRSVSVPCEDCDTDLRSLIQEIAFEFPGYGYRRITAELRNPAVTSITSGFSGL